mmetsp:Transcript_40137/g.126241  ORF Transcript_40137/g.126241 Transcript_40137/m.126241 type:complete len:241 (-) Transcript_40137:377-1099(-)
MRMKIELLDLNLKDHLCSDHPAWRVRQHHLHLPERRYSSLLRLHLHVRMRAHDAYGEVELQGNVAPDRQQPLVLLGEQAHAEVNLLREEDELVLSAGGREGNRGGRDTRRDGRVGMQGNEEVLSIAVDADGVMVVAQLVGAELDENLLRHARGDLPLLVILEGEEVSLRRKDVKPLREPRNIHDPHGLLIESPNLQPREMDHRGPCFEVLRSLHLGVDMVINKRIPGRALEVSMERVTRR